MAKELNIKSTTIEKGLDLAKEFLGKLISPTVEELGLFASDNIKFIRFKNQVKILLKAKKFVEENNITPKEIPIKMLVPLLENASLEDNEKLQDKWSNMLVNMAHSETNIQNQVFPYILSQLSIEEYDALLNVRASENELSNKHIELAKIRAKDSDRFTEKKIREEINKIEQNGFWLPIEQFEVANIARLGLIRQLPPQILINEFQTGGSEYFGREQWHQIDAEYDQENYGYRLTELGEKFLSICELKQTID